ncbi:MAG: TolB family protein [Acidimicrobiales bacterium]
MNPRAAWFGLASSLVACAAAVVGLAIVVWPAVSEPGDGESPATVSSSTTTTVPPPTTTTVPPPPPPPPLVFFARDVAGNMDIYSRNNRTLVESRLTDHPAEDSRPSVNYEPGSRVAFQSHRDGNFEIYVMDDDGSGERRLTSNPAEDTSPDWSPDKHRIVFVSTRDGNPELYVMNAEATSACRVAPT